MTKYITKITKMTEYIRNTLVFLFYVGRTKNRTKSECALSLLVMGLCSFTFLRFSSIGVERTVDWFEDGVIFSFWGADS